MRPDYQENINEILENLNLNKTQDTIKNCQENIFYLEAKIAEINMWLRYHEFETETEEIQFFKIHKPKLTAKLFYYKFLLDIHVKMNTSKKKRCDYLDKQLEKFSAIPKGLNKFWKYYRTASTNRDQEYFLRKNNNSDDNDQYHLVFIDERVTTKMECTLAKLMAKEQIVCYLDAALDRTELEQTTDKKKSKPHLEWTGTNLDFIELIYALHHNKVFNGGNKEVKEIAKALGTVCNIDLEDNLYRYYIDIKRRKKEKTPFLYSMAATLNKVIESEQ